MTSSPRTPRPEGAGGRNSEHEILVCAALHSSRLGGAEQSHLERASDLLNEGVVVHSILPAPDHGLGALLREAGLPVSLAQNSPWWIGIDDIAATLGGAPPLERFVSEEAVHESMEMLAQIRPDAVVTVTSVNPHGALAARALGIPHIWVLTELAVPIHGLHPTVPHLEIGRAILELSDQVVCVSRAVRSKFYGEPSEAEFAARGIHVIHNAPRMPAPSPERPAVVQKVTEPGQLTIGVIGTFAEGKGQAIAVDALSLLASWDKQARIMFFGQGSPEAVAELRARASEAGIAELVEFLHEPDRHAMYAMLDIVAVTSVQEGFGRVPFEAAASHRPVVYADDGALQEFMVPDTTGLAFRPHDAHSLARALERLIDDAELRGELAARAKQHLGEFCHTPSRGEQLRTVIDRAVSREKPGPWRDLAFDLRASALELGLRRAERDGLLSQRDGLVAELHWWRGQFHRLQARRSVRIALALARLIGRLRFHPRRDERGAESSQTEDASQPVSERLEDVTASPLDATDASQYREWIRANEDHGPAAFGRWCEAAGLDESGPTLSVMMPVYNPDIAFLREAVSSIANQWYPHWQLIMSDDGSDNAWFADAGVRRLLEDVRIRGVFRETNGGIAAATNSAIEAASAEWLVFLDQDDLLAPDALARVAEQIVRDPGVRLLYSDEDSIDESGERFLPYFKPRAVRELLLGQNVINHLSVLRRDDVMAVGGLRSEFDGSQDWDLVLRVIERLEDREIVHIPHILYHWRKTSETYSASTKTMAQTYGAGLRAVRDAVQRRGLSAEVSPVAHGSWAKVALRPSGPKPLASIIIPTRDHPELLTSCVDSVLFSTRYESFEVIIMDNGTRDTEALRFLEAAENRPRVTVIPWDRPFNFSELLNEGVRRAKGEIIVSLNNDVIVYQEDWLDQFVANAQRSDVGAVGARLLYADRHVQHGGVLLGVHAVAGHSFSGLGPSDPGYFGQAILNREVEAVTAAAMAVRRSVFLEHGGFDAENLAVAFNDVDFCLRLRRSGLRNLYLGSVEMTHLESRSRGKDDQPDRREGFGREVAFMRDTWGHDGGDLIDSIKNPNLLQREGDCLLPSVPSREN